MADTSVYASTTDDTRDSEEPTVNARLTLNPAVDAITTWGATRSQLEAILEGMAEGLLVFDAEHREVVYLNRAARTLLGFARDEGKRSLEWYNEQFPLSFPDGSPVPKGERPMSRILQGESFTGLELHFARDGALPRTGSFGGTLVQDSVLLGVLTLQDISARFEAEARFRAAFHASPTPTSIIRLSDARFVDVNARFTELTGFSRDELLGHTLSELNLRIESEKRDLAMERSKVGSMPTLERNLRRKDGTVLRVSSTGEVIVIDGERHLLDTFVDLTEQRRSEEELLQAIEEVMRDTSWFSRGVVEKLTNLRARAQNQEPPAELRELTPRERQVLGLMAQGQDNEQVAAILGISRNTVRNYVAGVYGKLGVSSRAEAVVWARERGITS